MVEPLKPVMVRFNEINVMTLHDAISYLIRMTRGRVYTCIYGIPVMNRHKSTLAVKS